MVSFALGTNKKTWLRPSLLASMLLPFQFACNRRLSRDHGHDLSVVVSCFRGSNLLKGPLGFLSLNWRNPKPSFGLAMGARGSVPGPSNQRSSLFIIKTEPIGFLLLNWRKPAITWSSDGRMHAVRFRDLETKGPVFS